MADNKTVEYSRRRFVISPFYALVGVVLLGLIVSYILPDQILRHHTQREPVIFWHMWAGEYKVVVDRIVDRFNCSQDKYEVIALSIPMTAADSKFLLAVSGGDPPDVMAQWNPIIPKWAESGLIQPLDSYMTAEQRRHFLNDAYPAARRLGMYNGRVYGMTGGLNSFACYYLPEQFKEAGLDPNHFPQTLEELTVAAKKLTKVDKSGHITRIGFLPPAWPGLRMFAPGFNGGLFDWKNGKLTIISSKNERALAYLAGERDKLGFEQILRFESGLNAGFSGGADWPFVTGAYSITLDGLWRVEQLRKFAPKLHYRTAPLPPPMGGPRNYGWTNGNFLIIPGGSKHSKGAWEFIKFWTGIENPKRASEFFTWGGWLPLFPEEARTPVYQAYIRRNPQFKTFLDVASGECIYPDPPVPLQTFLIDRLNKYEDLTYRGRLKPRQALEELQKDLDDENDRRKRFGYKD